MDWIELAVVKSILTFFRKTQRFFLTSWGTVSFSLRTAALSYYYYYYYYYYTIWMSLVTGLFCPVLLLNQRWSPPLRLQASLCSTFRIMCDVPSIAVFCSESIECFPGTASKFFLKLLVTIPVAPIIIIIIIIKIFVKLKEILLMYLENYSKDVVL